MLQLVWSTAPVVGHGCGGVDVAVVACRAGQAHCGRAASIAGVVRAGAALDGEGGVVLAGASSLRGRPSRLQAPPAW